MQLKQICLVTTLAVASLSLQNAKADTEIHSRVSPGFIRITDYADSTYGFELCRDSAGKDCTMLGSRKSYSVDELNYRSKRLRHEGYVMLADDAGWLVLGTVTAVAAVVLSTNPVSAPVVAVVAGSTALSSVVGILHGWLTPGNQATPIARMSEAKTINLQVMANNQAYLDIPIEDYANKLNLALDDMY